MSAQQSVRQVLIAAAAGVVASLLMEWINSRRSGCACRESS